MQFQTRPTSARPTPPPYLRRVDRPQPEPDCEYEGDDETAVQPEAAEIDEDTTEEPGTIIGFAAIGRYLWSRVTRAQALAIGVVIGVVIGLPVLGWWLWPVQWTNATFNELAPAEAALVIETVADYYAYSQDPVRVAAVLSGWQDGESLICAMAAQEDDFWSKARLISIAAVRNGHGCN